MNHNVSGASLSRTVSQQVMDLLCRYRRIDESLATGSGETTESERTAGNPHSADFLEVHRTKMERFVERGEPIHFVVPAFPAKSPNHNKVLGALPDLGEQLALGFLQSLCDYVHHLYSPGARVTICSDGHVFGDVVGVTDGSVTAYQQALIEMISTSHWSSLDHFDLNDAFGSMDYPKMRRILEENHSDTLEELREKVHTDRGTRSLFNGIHRFMFEDAVARRGEEASRSQLRKDSKEAAYQTILRSNAWSRVVADKFPGAIRLSIHPQPPESEKFGLRLIRSGDGWLTPWHGVVLDDGVNQYLVKRWDAEKLNATVVWRNGRPSHFVAPHLTALAS